MGHWSLVGSISKENRRRCEWGRLMQAERQEDDVCETRQPMPASETYEFEALAAAVNYRRAILDEFRPFLVGDVIEVGAGVGQTTVELRRSQGVRRVTAVEPVAEFCRVLRQRQVAHDVVQGTSGDIVAGAEYDAVVSVNVLEHIEDDMAELSRYKQLLGKRRGHLCLFVPARPELFAPLDERFGHYRRYRRSILRAKLDQAGFDVVAMRYFNFPGYFLWWIEFKILKQRAFNPRKVAMFDRLAFPLIRWVETRIVSPPLGQSILAVARCRNAGADVSKEALCVRKR